MKNTAWCNRKSEISMATGETGKTYNSACRPDSNKTSKTKTMFSGSDISMVIVPTMAHANGSLKSKMAAAQTGNTFNSACRPDSSNKHSNIFVFCWVGHFKGDTCNNVRRKRKLEIQDFWFKLPPSPPCWILNFSLCQKLFWVSPWDCPTPKTWYLFFKLLLYGLQTQLQVFPAWAAAILDFRLLQVSESFPSITIRMLYSDILLFYFIFCCCLVYKQKIKGQCKGSM